MRQAQAPTSTACRPSGSAAPPPGALAELRRQWHNRAEVPQAYRAATLAGIRSPEIRRAVAEVVADMRAFVHRGRQIIIMGPVGVGKSSVLGIVAAAARLARVRTRYVAVARICDWCHHDDGPRQLTAVERVPLLLLDDWGVEYGTEYHQAKLGQLIDARWAAMRPLCLTTNLTEQRLRQEYDGMERTWDRLFDASRTTILTLRGESRRRKAT